MTSNETAIASCGDDCFAREPGVRQPITLDSIVRATAGVSGVSTIDLCGPGKSRRDYQSSINPSQIDSSPETTCPNCKQQAEDLSAAVCPHCVERLAEWGYKPVRRLLPPCAGRRVRGRDDAGQARNHRGDRGEGGVMRGYFGIGVYHPKTEANIGTLWRSAHLFGASLIFTIGRRYKRQASDTTNAANHIPIMHYDDMEAFMAARPHGAPLVGIELGGQPLDANYAHPERAVYLLGSEDHGLPPEVLALCQRVVTIETPYSLNVAVAGSIVLFDRAQKQRRLAVYA